MTIVAANEQCTHFCQLQPRPRMPPRPFNGTNSFQPITGPAPAKKTVDFVFRFRVVFVQIRFGKGQQGDTGQTFDEFRVRQHVVQGVSAAGPKTREQFRFGGQRAVHAEIFGEFHHFRKRHGRKTF